MIKNKLKYLGFPCSLEYPGVLSRRWFFPLDFPRASKGFSGEPFARPLASAAVGARPALPGSCCSSLLFFSVSGKSSPCSQRGGAAKLCSSLEKCAAGELEGEGGGMLPPHQRAENTHRAPCSAHAAVLLPGGHGCCPTAGRFFHFSVEIELVKQKQITSA